MDYDTDSSDSFQRKKDLKTSQFSQAIRENLKEKKVMISQLLIVSKTFKNVYLIDFVANKDIWVKEMKSFIYPKRGIGGGGTMVYHIQY